MRWIRSYGCTFCSPRFDFSSIDLFLICPAMDSDMMGRSWYRKENGKAFWKCPAGLDMCSLLS